MQRTPRTAWLLVGLALLGAPAHAAPRPAQSPGWFVPPPANPADGSTVDTRSYGNFEDITVTAPRRAAPVQSNPHGEEMHEYEPGHSLASSPDQKPTTPSGYCGSSYQTVAGQAATGADMVGFGSGRCN